MHVDAESTPCAERDHRHAAKAAATQIARAALAGYQLAQMADGSFVVQRWGMVAALDGADAVENFLVRVGAPA